ncbi:MAG: transcriptional repressor [Desulfomonile tiedjei]|nr:transcriptional repressor [Desulfomonile tiedjei]
MTEQRRVILEELKKLKSHPTADELYLLVRNRLPNISLGTVYRNLEILSEAGMILKLETAGSQKRFDGTAENHYHVRCVGCGRVEDVSLEVMSAVENAAQNASGYRILSHRLEFLGICPSCRHIRSQEASRANNGPFSPDFGGKRKNAVS